MTDGPYTGTIRSNTPSGLGGIFTQLALIVGGLGSLPQIAADLAAIRVLTERLVGTGPAPAAWPGLPGAIGWPGEQLGDTVMNNIEALRVLTNTIATYLGVANVSYVKNMRDQFLSATGGNNNWTASMLAAQLLIRDDADALAQVVGTVAAAPIGSTLKDLIRSIDVNALRSADCCEAGGSTPPPPGGGLNPAPAAFCGGAGARVQSFHLVRTETTAQPQTFTYWQAIFATPAGTAQVNGTTDAARRGYRLVGQNIARDICISWDFTGGAVIPVEFGRNKSNALSSSVDANTTGSPPLGGASTLQSGGLSDELRSCVTNDPGDDIVAYVFKVSGSTAPALNAFISTIIRQCPA